MIVLEGLEQRLRQGMAALDAEGLLRSLRTPEGLDLCSNDYLGLASDPRIVQGMMAAVAREGCGSTGSRLLRGHRDAFASVERRFAEFKRTDRSLYFSSGYLANLAVLTTFPRAGDLVFSDEHNHASLIDGIRLSRARCVVFRHSDVDALARLLREEHTTGQRFLVTESLFSMDGDEAPLADYASLCREFEMALIVDEAHAVGVCGVRGTGLIESTAIEEDVFVSVNTAGKALGVSGAFVAGPERAIEYLMQRGRPFVFSTAPPPAVAGAIETSLAIVASEPARRATLGARARHLRRGLANAGIPVAAGSSHIVPVLIGGAADAVAVALILQAEGFDVRAIRPPTVPAGTSRLRVSVNVNITEAALDRFVQVLTTALVNLASCPAVSS